LIDSLFSHTSLIDDSQQQQPAISTRSIDYHFVYSNKACLVISCIPWGIALQWTRIERVGKDWMHAHSTFKARGTFVNAITQLLGVAFFLSLQQQKNHLAYFVVMKQVVCPE